MISVRQIQTSKDDPRAKTVTIWIFFIKVIEHEK